MKLSVVIPAYDRLPELLECLYSLRAYSQTQPEFIVQDDASPSYNAPAVIHPAFAHVQRNPHNVGFGSNCNAGAARASGDVLMFVNQDVYAVSEWSHGWDAAVLSAFEDAAVGIVGARLLFPTGQIQSAGGVFDAKCQPHHRCLGYSNPLYVEVNEPRPVSWVTGAALAVRRSLFEQAGGFNPAYERGYFEDVDLCLNVREQGHTVQYEPRCTLIHRTGTSGGSPYFARNAALFRQRWVETGKVKPDVLAVKERFW